MEKSLNWIESLVLLKIASCPRNTSTFRVELKIYLEKQKIQLNRNVTGMSGFLGRGFDKIHLFPAKSERQREKGDFWGILQKPAEVPVQGSADASPQGLPITSCRGTVTLTGGTRLGCSRGEPSGTRDAGAASRREPQRSHLPRAASRADARSPTGSRRRCPRRCTTRARARPPRRAAELQGQDERRSRSARPEQRPDRAGPAPPPLTVSGEQAEPQHLPCRAGPGQHGGTAAEREQRAAGRARCAARTAAGRARPPRRGAGRAARPGRQGRDGEGRGQSGWAARPTPARSRVGPGPCPRAGEADAGVPSGVWGAASSPEEHHPPHSENALSYLSAFSRVSACTQCFAAVSPEYHSKSLALSDVLPVRCSYTTARCPNTSAKDKEAPTPQS